MSNAFTPQNSTISGSAHFPRQACFLADIFTIAWQGAHIFILQRHGQCLAQSVLWEISGPHTFPAPLPSSAGPRRAAPQEASSLPWVPWDRPYSSLPCATGMYITLAVFSYLAFSRPYYLTRQKHPALTASLPQQQVLVLAEPKRKPSTFWHSISRLAPFRK